MKPKIFDSEFSDLQAVVSEAGWIELYNKTNKMCISLGTPPNTRIELVMRAIDYAQKNILKEKRKFLEDRKIGLGKHYKALQKIRKRRKTLGGNKA